MAVAVTAPQLAKTYPLRKRCNRCGRRRATKPIDGNRAGKFRILSSGYLQGMCVDCERDYERDRWQNRSPASRRAA